jgi:hypothetical protein
MASRQLLIPHIAAVGTSFSPVPCQAWHGYGVTSALRVEVEVGADVPASAPPSGAAAAAPPAGALPGEYLRVLSHEINIGLAEREIHVLVYGYCDLPKPSVHGFPTVANPADRSCRYLV